MKPRLMATTFVARPSPKKCSGKWPASLTSISRSRDRAEARDMDRALHTVQTIRAAHTQHVDDDAGSLVAEHALVAALLGDRKTAVPAELSCLSSAHITANKSGDGTESCGTVRHGNDSVTTVWVATTVTYCLPLTWYVIGVALIVAGALKENSCLPDRASKAYKV